jgi:hypothetical protein
MTNNNITFYTSSFEDLVFLFEREEEKVLRYKRTFFNVSISDEFFKKYEKFLYKESSTFLKEEKEKEIKEIHNMYFWVINDGDKKIYLYNKEPYKELSKEICKLEICKLNLYFEEYSETVKELINDIINLIDVKEKKKGQVNIIINVNNNLILKPFDLTKQNIDFNKHYNPDLKEFVDDMLEGISDTTKGLYLLHGKPGTGKTSLIRWLITNCDKKVIYIPPDMTSILSDPNFMKFLSNHPKSILLIEDAETVLMKRVSGGSSAIQNILNLSDGLLSDILNIQVIATFNTNVKDIDSALLRPGRLKGIYEFTELNEDITLSLCEELGVPYDELKDRSLAEIFNFNCKFGFEKNIKTKKKSIGFSKV